MKRLVFWTIILLPLSVIIIIPTYLLLLTNLPQLLYIQSIRNVYYDCLTFVEFDYVYRAKPGPCHLTNLEHDIILSHDREGFRNPDTLMPADIAIIGDSHAHGFGVSDKQTFSELLRLRGYRTLNLAIGSFATERELAALARHASDVKYVVVQYCDNDLAENAASLRLNQPDFAAEVRARWAANAENYHAGKLLGWRKVLSDFARMLVNGYFSSKSRWRSAVAIRDMNLEAVLFRQVLEHHRELLDGKRWIILESAGWGHNSPKFKASFDAELRKISGLQFLVLDSAKLLEQGDYYFFDDHLNSSGHAKLAAALANEIARWEGASRTINPPSF